MNNIIKRENGHQPSTFGSVVDQVFQNNLNRFFDDEFWGFNGLNKFSNSSQAPVNIRETETTYEMELYAPGFQKQNFRLDLEGDTFTVSAERSQESKSGGKNDGWIRQEYRNENFTRSFKLDDTVEASKIVARYEDGILHLTFPKKEHAQKISRSINIQ